MVLGEVMRLSNSIRLNIIDSEIKKKGYSKKLDSNENEIRREIKRLIKLTIPKWANKERQKLGYFQTTSSFNVKGNSSYFNCVDLCKYRLFTDNLPVNNSYEHKIEASARLDGLINVRKKVLKERGDFRSSLSKVLYAYTTDKALLKQVPELAKHFKNNDVVTAIVPIEQINKVREALKKS